MHLYLQTPLIVASLAVVPTAMFALWYLSFAIDEIRKRLGYPSLFASSKTDTIIPPSPAPVTPEVKQEEVKPKEPEKKPQPERKVEPAKKPEPPKIVPKTPEPKNNGGSTGKQPESPETQELMKTYEIPEKDDAKKKPDPVNGASGVRQVSPKPKESPKTPSKSPSPAKNGNLAAKAKSPKDATTAFLAEESSTKRVEPTKRYPKTVKRP